MQREDLSMQREVYKGEGEVNWKVYGGVGPRRRAG
jgi:hypothetical protein